MKIHDIVDVETHPITSEGFRAQCNTTLENGGALVLKNFIREEALSAMLEESEAKQNLAYFCTQSHSAYLTPNDPSFAQDHPANRTVESSKGCICDDVIDAGSPLRSLYDDKDFRDFVSHTTGQPSLHPYADPLSSINIHYANRGQELGWHFDNSSFAITLLIQKPDAGSRFEYLKDLRNAEIGEMNYNGVAALLEGEVQPQVLSMGPGDLVLFRGRNSIHRVSPNESDKTRMLAVLAYNTEPGIKLSENARMTFYGRLR